MDVRSRFVKVVPQPKPQARTYRVMFVFNINWDIFRWRDNQVKPEQYTAGDTWDEAFPWAD